MANPLNLFPARVPIGRINNADGTSVDVLMTREFSNALSDLLVRVGGSNGMSNDEIAALAASGPSPDQVAMSALAELQELRQEVASLQQVIASLVAVKKQVEQIQLDAAYTPKFTVPWDRPGNIGLRTPSTGAFTTVSASGQITSTVGDGTAPMVVTSSTRVVNLNSTFLNGGTWQAPGAIGSTTPNSGVFSTFGCNGRPAQSAYALPGAATDAASNLNLTNAIRLALINVGIGA